jgi:hypothetical protein
MIMIMILMVSKLTDSDDDDDFLTFLNEVNAKMHGSLAGLDIYRISGPGEQSTDFL